MKIQNKINRYAVNATAVNFEAQVRKMQKAIELAEQELQQAHEMFAEFVATPILPEKKEVASLVLELPKTEEVAPLVLEIPSPDEEIKEVKKEVVRPVLPVVEQVMQGLVLDLPATETPEEVEPLKLEIKEEVRVVDKVKQNMPPKTTPNPQTGFIAGPAQPGIILNSARMSHKHQSLEYLEKLRVFMYSGILKLAEAGVRELHVAELDGIEFLMPLIWESVLVKFPDMKLVLFSNGKNNFEKYKTDEYEESFKIHSPYRLQQQLRKIATRVVMVEGNAFAVRRAVAKDTNGYVRISPFKMQDATTPLYKGKSLCVQICPWTLAVEVGGGLQRLSKPGDGNDYRPTHVKKAAEGKPVTGAPTH